MTHFGEQQLDIPGDSTHSSRFEITVDHTRLEEVRICCLDDRRYRTNSNFWFPQVPMSLPRDFLYSSLKKIINTLCYKFQRVYPSKERKIAEVNRNNGPSCNKQIVTNHRSD